MRASRLLSILLTLSVRGQVAASELAGELEVSVRTIYRDVEALSAAGVPVYASRGRAGGIALLDGFRTRLTGMTSDEADALFLTGLPTAAGDLGLGNVLAATQLKLLAALPPGLRERAERIRETFYLDAPGWLRDDESPAHLPTVAEATWTAHRLDVRYRRSDRSVVVRRLDPLGLVLKGGTWYLVAAVPDDARGPRTYRVSRVMSAAVTGDAAQQPDGFDLAVYWTDYQRDYAERVYRDSARVRLDPEAQRMLFLVGSVAARRARETFGEPDRAGWVTADVPIESERHALHAFLQLGEHLEVLEPISLRTAVADAARATAARYSAVGGS
ncbi:YafY family protein [Jatrophihabitans endophyticus]|uniref:helix-turn-helix transcriptional regulator n=1 Tax=Jatrophihabitans endophyticus TaxID=1206085 RepID=UPI0019F85128|nr:YafY family protein [Jatrophihabitans endophyticus]MBE7189124.1 YafY family transcriptional regulator [Jatrophihabitans endophyticus]